MYDVAIIGGGISGAAVAYELCRRKLNICVIEKENDISMGTTRANSGIVHAGYDPVPGSLMARLNVRGAELTEEIAQKFGVPYKKIGSMVLAFSDEEQKTLETLYERGKKNQVKRLSIIGKDEIEKLEPNISKDVQAALYAPDAAVINPWRLCLAFAETAALNGCDFILDNEVTSIEQKDDCFVITSGIANRKTKAKFVVNAAGVCSDIVCKMVADCDFEIKPSKGQYYLLDKSCAGFVNTVLFQCPTEKGKGVLVSPTADGNLIIGPDAESSERDSTNTTSEGLAYVSKWAKKTALDIPYRENIRNFAGVRANSNIDDFIIAPAKNVPHFINCAGIKSPGLSSAPAIGEYVASLLFEAGLCNELKEDLKYPEKHITFSELSAEEKREIIKKDPAYGNVICRCNTITEGEIINALNSPIPPITVDGIKRRAGTGLGRCQGGFCSPRVHELIAKYKKIDYQNVLMDKKGSYIVKGKVGEQDA